MKMSKKLQDERDELSNSYCGGVISGLKGESYTVSDWCNSDDPEIHFNEGFNAAFELLAPSLECVQRCLGIAEMVGSEGKINAEMMEQDCRQALKNLGYDKT